VTHQHSVSSQHGFNHDVALTTGLGVEQFADGFSKYDSTTSKVQPCIPKYASALGK
jgi:hypothetical protein